MLISRLKNFPQNQKAKLLGIIGLYNPQEKNLLCIVCPENISLEGNVYPVEPSKKNIESADIYAQKTGKQARSAIEYMDSICSYCRKDRDDISPKVLFYFPSAYFENEKIVININPFSCRPLYCDGSTNAVYPVYGYCGVEAHIASIDIGKKTKNGKTFDQLIYFVSSPKAPTHEYFLNNPEFGNILLREAKHNPIMDYLVSPLQNEDNSIVSGNDLYEAVRFELCPTNHPEIALYSNVCLLNSYGKNQTFTSGDDILEFLTNNIASLFENPSDENILKHIREKILVKCKSGFCLYDNLWDASEEYEESVSKRFKIPLSERSSCVVSGTCMPPLKRIPDEDKRLLYTVRSLTLTDKVSNELIFPQGYGIVTLDKKRDKYKNEDIFKLSLRAGFLPHSAVQNNMMKGTRYSLAGKDISYEKVLDFLLHCDNEKVVDDSIALAVS